MEAGILGKTSFDSEPLAHNYNLSEELMGFGGYVGGTIGIDFGKINIGFELWGGSYHSNKPEFRAALAEYYVSQNHSLSFSNSYFSNGAIQRSKDVITCYFPITYELTVGKFNLYPSIGACFRSHSYADLHFALKPYNSNYFTDYYIEAKAKLKLGMAAGFDVIFEKIPMIMLKSRCSFGNATNDFTFSSINHLEESTIDTFSYTQFNMVWSVGLSVMMRSDQAANYR